MPNLQNSLDNTQESMFNWSGHFYIKSINGDYLSCNNSLLETIELTSPDDLIGKNDQNHKYAKHARIIMKNDLAVCTNKIAIARIEPVCDDKDNVLLFSSHKEPLFYNGKVIGSQGRSIQISSHQIGNSDILNDLTIFLNIKTNKRLNLSISERKTLFYIQKGYSAKETARHLSLSHRTVEHRVMAIRDKTGFITTRDLIINTRSI